MVRIRMIMAISLSRVCSKCRQSGHPHPDAVHGRRRRDVEASVVDVAPGEVGRVFGREDDTETRSLGVEDVDPARAATVDVARGIDLHAVGGACAFAYRLCPDAASRQRAVALHVEDSNVLPGGVVDEQAPSIEREAQTVGPVEIVHEKDRALRVDARAVHALERELLLARDTVELGSAIRRITEIDSAVRRADDVVRAVELLALVVSGKRDAAAVGFCASDLARRVLAGQEAPLPIPGEAVRHAARLAIRGDAVAGRPAAKVIARHVAPEQVLLPWMPQRALGEEAARRDALEVNAGPDDLFEARVPDR